MKNSLFYVNFFAGFAIFLGILLTSGLIIFIMILASYRNEPENEPPLFVVNLVSQVKSTDKNQPVKKTSPKKNIEKSKPKKTEPLVEKERRPILEKPQKISETKNPVKKLKKIAKIKASIEKTEEIVKPKTSVSAVKKTEPIEVTKSQPEENVSVPEKHDVLMPDSTLPVMNSTVETNKLPVPTPIFQLTQPPRFLHKEPPVYPKTMRTAGVSGVVKIEVLIDRKGQVRKINILKSAGKYFDQSAKRAILASSFYPAEVDKKPVAVLLRLPVKYRLN